MLSTPTARWGTLLRMTATSITTAPPSTLNWRTASLTARTKSPPSFVTASTRPSIPRAAGLLSNRHRVHHKERARRWLPGQHNPERVRVHSRHQPGNDEDAEDAGLRRQRARLR